MEYKSYQHIEKLNTTEVDGILEGTVYLSYKIDGTNACVWLKDDGTLGFGSRKRELSVDSDNANFMTSLSTQDKYKNMFEDLYSYLHNYPSHIIYGEWLVKHTLTTYKDDAWKEFYIFDIYDTCTHTYINYDIYSSLFDRAYTNLKYIPIITKLNNPTKEEVILYLDKTGEWLVTKGLGEGIVIKNYEFVNKYGRRTWAKVLTEDFSETKKTIRNENHTSKENNPVEYNIIKLLTKEYVLKEKNKIEEARGEWSSKHIFELLNKVFNEFIRDNLDIILKKFHLPTINFKKLKALSDAFVKEVLNGN